MHGKDANVTHLPSPARPQPTDYTFIPMTREYAAAIVEGWKYPGEYVIYNYTHEAEHMLDPEAWGVGLFAILDTAGELVGELSIEFYDERGHHTEYTRYADKDLINERELWIGFGMRPDLIGQGRGAAFVQACVDYSVQCTGYRGEYARLGVATFNQRAIRAYRRAGFEIYEHSRGPIAGQVFETVFMRKNLEPVGRGPGREAVAP